MDTHMLTGIDVRCTIYRRRLMSLLRRAVHNMRSTVSIGRGTLIDGDVAIRTVLGASSVSVGENCEIRKGVMLINDCGGHITIGNNTSLNPYTMVYEHGGVTIGNGVRIAAHTMIVAFNHRFDGPGEIRLQGFTLKGIRIEDDVWIGGGVKILDGVTVGRGCVIAAGSVVTKSTEPYSVYGGVPARLIKQRMPDHCN